MATTAKAKTRSNPGRRLELARRRSGLARQAAADRLNIPVQAVKYLDRWELDKIDESYRSKSVVRRYALLVGLNPADYEHHVPYKPAEPYRFKPMIVLSRLSLSATAVILGLAVIGFLGWRTFVAAARPALDLAQPVVGLITDQPTTAVAGQTSEQAQVYVNGFNVPVDPGGGFNTSVILVEGTNTITITAINSFGRQTQAKRIVRFIP